ncbi:MiaB/RimO family radical SAM methylthiotransferase [archaeon]|jgi:threonylcarbamoyladenosine tRNA methylthiotransferase CDKAL1|nr:MiaB/RimO family radical SAM methylthiotransferase [archaeon]MBT4241642.1 MiaB/RimO family radical SAM methylthiotransferase [archaeon]MBT4418037.1 MiaB/RimO family radical SAM methylthiotransferase [archaeon]
MKNYIFIETYGCSANQNNSEIMKGILTQSGYNITNNQEIAEIIILNTCIVKQKTENKIKRRIQDMGREAYSDKMVIITGCMPETDLTAIKKLNPKALVLGTHNIKSIIKLLNDYKNSNLKQEKEYLPKTNEEKILLPKIPNNKLISIIQISEGCKGSCTYCKTKLAKGKLFSYNKEKIIKSIESDLQNKAKEVWITSQDNASYGLDRIKNTILKKQQSKHQKINTIQQTSQHSKTITSQQSQLPELLTEILNLKHNFKLRLGMMNPNNLYPILDQMIEIYKHPKMYKFLHIPIQSASNNILKNMKRHYKMEIAEKIIKKFKKEIPNITIATDIIIGYPNETPKDFQENINFIKEFKPDVFNLSKFSLHKGTEIYNTIKQNKAKQVPIETINKRTTKIMQLHRETALENKEKFINKNIKVFINKKLDGDLLEARDENYNIILIKGNKELLGKTIQVKIKSAGVHHMVGEVVEG